ncbi:glycosyltransferase [Cohnella sp. AR92]|uniref:glycosyltransferase n=1 Tax=Cohnella sp. AR92 TaxID=648716 RepID=UPI000F8CC2C4|nr:glycosyltransferase [Cohnella sp. AR92]RUS46465.1 glycosyltransferase [Cohnella sp. AR92]
MNQSAGSRPEDLPFFSFGRYNQIEQPGQVMGAEEISIGSGVVLRYGYWLNVCTPVTGERPKIVIGDGVHTHFGLRLSAANSIVLEPHSAFGPNVYIADTDHQYRYVGLPVIHQGITRTDGSVVVGEGTWVGSNVVIAGSIKIGKGCVIGANSIVTRDVPDYCVAIGSPAKVVKAFDPDAGDWVRIRDEEQLRELLRARRERPLLTIGIPTYNRASDLQKCLETLLPQIGENGLIEVCVSDNASTDETPRVLAGFVEQHPRLRVRRNAANLGAERNFLELIPFARGKFLKLHGDDDFFLPTTVQPLLHAVLQLRNRSVLFLDILREEGGLEAGEGMDDFLREASFNAGFITSLILDREALLGMEGLDRHVGSGFNHVHWVYRLLERNPLFGLVRGNRFSHAYNEPAGYNFGDYFIRGYLQVLGSFAGRGLGSEALSREKLLLVQNLVLPWLKQSEEEGLGTDVAGFEDIFEEHYRDEPYFEEARKHVRHALARLEDSRDREAPPASPDRDANG